ncbi:hypothetical protein H0E84_06820 [Luteimonas sp. SJ-92]|uniref:Uncharacterized protein n=1 Tax=Luteimonas salinisoli TaxID=2752307 RepID=A0A853JBG9_9GAMM|nr:hypothetical protein [Luteimonas salinisoli]NZA26094.1 hypothetical protein [Luteimonas salinisoli]
MPGVAGGAPVPPGRAAGIDAPFALDRVGDARIGEAFSADDWLADWVAAGAQEHDPYVDCEQYTGDALPRGMSMMVMDGAIARFELTMRQDPAEAVRYRAPFGVHLGQIRGEAFALLPEGAQAAPHEYEAPEGEYLTWRDPASTLGIRLETYDGLVDAIYWGDAGAATLGEGCM